MTFEAQDIQLTIRAIGLTSGDSFVLGECVRLWGVVGTVKSLQQQDEEYTVEVWRRTVPLSESDEHEVTVVKIPSASILWVAAGHLFVRADGTVHEKALYDEEE